MARAGGQQQEHPWRCACAILVPPPVGAGTTSRASTTTTPQSNKISSKPLSFCLLGPEIHRALRGLASALRSSRLMVGGRSLTGAGHLPLPLLRRVLPARSPAMTAAPSSAAAAVAAVRRRRRRRDPLQPQPDRVVVRAGISSSGEGAAEAVDSPAGEAAAGSAAAGSAAAAAADDTALTASSSWEQRDTPLGSRIIWRLLLQQKRHLALAAISLILCVSMNLLSPVLQGMLFDVLVRGQPFQQ